MGIATQIGYVPARLRGVFYGWWLVGVSGFVMVMATVPLFHAMPAWSVALRSEFGWSHGQLGLALALTRIEGGIMGPVEGYLTDRVGTRRMVLTGLLILGLGYLLLSQVQNLWMFYLAYVVLALGQGLGSWLPLMTMLNNWFSRQRARAIGWSNVGSRFGGLFLVPAIAWAVNPDHDRLGWQLTATILGVFILAMAFPVTRLIRDRPQDYNLLPDGDPPARTQQDPSPLGSTQPRTRVVPEADLTAVQALKTPAFWFISFGHGFTSMVILAIMAHLGLFMQDKGFSIQSVGWVVAIYTAVSMVFQIVGGFVGDRVPKNVALFAFTSVQASAVLVLVYSSSLTSLYLFAAIFGMGFGGRNPLTVAIRGEYFGRASFGKILGLSTVPMNVLLLGAAPFAGYLRDAQETYNTAFLVLAGLNFLGALLFLAARRPAQRPSAA